MKIYVVAHENIVCTKEYRQMQEFYKQCYYNLGDFDLIIEN